MKCGHPLQEYRFLPEAVKNRLAGELSVTTAEELIGMYQVQPKLLAAMFKMREDDFSEMVRQVRSRLPQETVKTLEAPPSSSYPFSTGHDAPDRFS